MARVEGDSQKDLERKALLSKKDILQLESAPNDVLLPQLRERLLHRKELPFVITSIDSTEFGKSAAKTCDVLEMTNVLAINSVDAQNFAEYFPTPQHILKRFPNLEHVVHVLSDGTVVYTREGVFSVSGNFTDKRDAVRRYKEMHLLSQLAESEQWLNVDIKKHENSTDLDPRAEIRQAICNGDIPPFVYTYPPRAAYRPLEKPLSAQEIWKEDLEHSQTRDLNLYIHFPFCRYKCGFCNLYTVTNIQHLLDAYTDAVVKQLHDYREILEARKLTTIYIGGGTPMLMKKEHFKRIVDAIAEIVPNWRETVREFCIEASPDSIVNPSEPDVVEYFIENGLTRTNLGLQSTDDQELIDMGRPISAQLGWDALDLLKEKGLSNLSTDLIMGFQGQTEESWMKSVHELLTRHPETISTYFLTVRPDNRFGRSGRYTFYRDPKLYRWYELARQEILAEGYVQESNVRYIIPGRGGYEQKVSHQVGGTPILGIGAGARSYTQTYDYIIGGDAHPSAAQIKQYIHNMVDGDHTITAAFGYDQDERVRKRLALGLFEVDLHELDAYDFAESQEKYMPLLNACVAEGLVEQTGPTHYKLTPTGYKYRDILSWMFFSNRATQQEADFYQQLIAANQIGLSPKKKE